MKFFRNFKDGWRRRTFLNASYRQCILLSETECHIANYLLMQLSLAVPGNIGHHSFSHGPRCALSVPSQPRTITTFPCSLKNSSLFIEKIHYQNVVFFSEKPNLFLPCRNWEGPPSKDTAQAKAQELFSSGSGWMDQFSIEMLIQIIQLSLLLFLLYRKETFLQSV